MSKKKELKKLIERIEAIEAEIKAFKETADKNVATISAEIEKLAAASKPVAEVPAKRTRRATTKKATAKPEVKAEPVKETVEKPARKPRAAKKPVVQAAPEQVEPAPVVEKKSASAKPIRTRKPKAVAPRTARASFALYNCDEAKSPESKYNRNDETFIDSQKGRRGLWNKLKTEITEKRIELQDNYPIRNVRVEIQSGNPVSVSQHLKYGLIEKV